MSDPKEMRGLWWSQQISMSVHSVQLFSVILKIRRWGWVVLITSQFFRHLDFLWYDGMSVLTPNITELV